MVVEVVRQKYQGWGGVDLGLVGFHETSNIQDKSQSKKKVPIVLDYQFKSEPVNTK